MKTYKINLFNQSNEAQQMWCFLANPNFNLSSDYYGSSNTYLTVPQYRSGQQNSFRIPLQYVVEVGASDQSVNIGMDMLAGSKMKINTELGSEWGASYFQEATKRIGPTLERGERRPFEELVMSTNMYDKCAEKANDWYGRMTYGLQSRSGLVGLTWSPDPGITYQVKPTVGFYITLGSFVPNSLVDISQIAPIAALVTEDSFDNKLECTVSLTLNGGWIVQPGYNPPIIAQDKLAALGKAHLTLTTAHKELAKMVAKNKTTNLAVIPSKKEENKRTPTLG